MVRCDGMCALSLGFIEIVYEINDTKLQTLKQ
jgi:hypothetical protein